MVEGVDGGERGASALHPALVATEAVAGSAGREGATPVVVVARRLVLGESIAESSTGGQGDQGAQPSERVVTHQRGTVLRCQRAQSTDSEAMRQDTSPPVRARAP